MKYLVQFAGKKKPCRTHYEIQRHTPFEVKVQPDQAYSVKELMARFVRGLPLPQMNDYHYTEEDILKDPTFDGYGERPIDVTQVADELSRTKKLIRDADSSNKEKAAAAKKELEYQNLLTAATKALTDVPKDGLPATVTPSKI